MTVKSHFTSPRAIAMLAHYAARREPYIAKPFQQWPDKDKSTLLAFISAELVELNDQPEHETHYKLSDRGNRVLGSIKHAIRGQLDKQDKERAA